MSLNDEAVLQAAANVALSVQVAVDPKSDGAARLQAHQFYEDFRNKAAPLELCAVGFALCTRTEEPVILAGLQMIENVAKYNWSNLTDRQSVKDRLLQLMYSGLSSGSACWPSYLQEALSKVIVEIAKREWPQLWPDLFPKLFEIANASDLALRVLRRMAEDVVTLQLVNCAERRRELSQSLTILAPEVISTLFNVLISSVKEYNASHTDTLKRRGKVCLGCLLPYIEWQNPLVFIQENRLTVLFALLPEKEFQIEAADCIIQLLERKPLKKEDKYEVPKICLDNVCCVPLLKSIDDSVDNPDFIRKAGEIVALLAPHIVDGKVNIENFFNSVLKLASKPQAAAVLGSALAINQYLKAQNSSADLSETPVGKALICVLNSICTKFVSAPPEAAEKDELSRLKTEFSQMLRNVGKYLPKLYKEVNSWLHTSLINPNTVQVYQWETLVLVIDGVASSISHKDKEMIEIGLRDLEQCYNKFKAEAVLELKSIILSTVSALFIFLSLAKQAGSFGETHLTFMHSILESIFQCFNYENVTYARDIRRHAAALMIKLSTKYPDLMALAFNFIHSSTLAAAPKLSSMEYTTLIESLLITCNCWNDPVKQSVFIRSLLAQTEWNEISVSSESLQAFVKNLQELGFQDKRILFVKNFTILNSIIRRVKKSSKSNGILQLSHATENSNTTNNSAGHIESETQHPAFDVICPLLPVVLKLVKVIHSVLDDPQLTFLMDLNEQERSHIMGIHFSGGAQTAAGESLPISGTASDSEKSHPEKLRVFIQTLVDLTYGILGGAASLFTPKFYYIPQVAEAYLSFVGWNNSKMNDFRLRGVIRTVFSPFLINCPMSQVEAVVKPFLQNFCPFMLERMINRWTAIENANNSSGDAEEIEVLENTSLRLLSKDYIDLLHKLLEMKPCQGTVTEGDTGSGTTGVEKNDISNSNLPNTNSQQTPSNEPGDLGHLLLEDPSCFQAIVQLCIHALCWDDSNLCLKSSRCILLSWRKVMEHPDLINATFGTTLRALCVWYENEANLDCLIKILDLAFKSCYHTDARLLQLLKEWGANDQDVQRLIALCNGVKSDKMRKDLYRKMVFNNPALEINRSPKAQWLRGLPQLQLAKPKDGKQASPDYDLSECFSIIHQT